MKKVIRYERRGHTYEVSHDLPDGTCILRKDDGTHISETWDNVNSKYRVLTNVEFDGENDEIVNDEGWHFKDEPPVNRRRPLTRLRNDDYIEGTIAENDEQPGF